jgi:hypothetical protein
MPTRSFEEIVHRTRPARLGHWRHRPFASGSVRDLRLERMKRSRLRALDGCRSPIRMSVSDLEGVWCALRQTSAGLIGASDVRTQSTSVRRVGKTVLRLPPSLPTSIPKSALLWYSPDTHKENSRILPCARIMALYVCRKRPRFYGHHQSHGPSTLRLESLSQQKMKSAPCRTNFGKAGDAPTARRTRLGF